LSDIKYQTSDLRHNRVCDCRILNMGEILNILGNIKKYFSSIKKATQAQ
jgi:hypothetical protein